MKPMNSQPGYTLVELMIVVGIIGMIAGIAIPVYNGYLTTAAMGTAQANAQTLSGFQDNYFYENETYLEGSYIPPGANGLIDLGWAPAGDEDQFNYVVAAGADGIEKSCVITVTYKNDPNVIVTINKP